MRLLARPESQIAVPLLPASSLVFVAAIDAGEVRSFEPSLQTIWISSSSIVTQPLMAGSSLMELVLVGGIAIGLVVGIGLGALLFGLKFWYRTGHRNATETVNTRTVANTSLQLADYHSSRSKLEPQSMLENMVYVKYCVKCGKALPLNARYCSECREEQDYY